MRIKLSDASSFLIDKLVRYDIMWKNKHIFYFVESLLILMHHFQLLIVVVGVNSFFLLFTLNINLLGPGIQTSNSTSAKLCYKSSDWLVFLIHSHKLPWKILIHGHVRIFLNFATFPLIVLIKIEQIIKNIFFQSIVFSHLWTLTTS